MTVRLIEGVMKMKLAGKVAIVTGGGIGIGRNTALLLAKQGAKVIVTDIESGQATVEEITNLGGEALFVSYDMEKQGDWQRVISITLNAFSRIDMLFQNAGLYKIDSIFSRQQENDSNVLCINDVWIEIKQLTSSL